MTKYTLLLCLCWLTSISLFAQRFSFSDTKNGFAYNSKGECLLMTNPEGAAITFQDNDKVLRECKWYQIAFNFEADSATIDTISIPKSNFTYSSDSTKVTLKITDANIGYLVEYGDNSCDIDRQCHAFTWVTNYLPLEKVDWAKDSVFCSNFELTLSPTMSYRTEYGSEKKVQRTLEVSYQSFLANNGTPGIGKIKAELSGSSYVTLEQFPYEDTPFTITDLTNSADKKTIETDTFFTQAVVAYPYISTTKAFDHEADEGIDSVSYFTESFGEALNNAKLFRSSAPLKMNFYSNSNSMSNHYEWAIAEGEDAQRGHFRNAFVLFEKEINAYMIEDPNMYCIELTVSNIRNDSVCEHKSYSCFRIAESALQVPNAFTPNGDGSNDEFRVAYRSIETFECNIYDRWGRKVYESTDISTGWDGQVNGKLTHPGTYFYVIKAVGTDGVEYLEKGTVNLLRGKEK